MKLGSLLKHKFLRDTTTLQVGSLIYAAGNFLSAVALTHFLGARTQGEYYVAIAMYSFLWFLVNVGLASVTVSQVAAATVRGGREKAGAWLAYLVKAQFALGMIVAVVGGTLMPTIAERVLDSERQIGLWAALLCLTPLIEIPRVVACAGLQGTRRMLPLAQIENGQELVRVFLVIMGALITRSATGPIIGALVSSLVGSIIGIDLYRREARRAGSQLPPLREILPHVRDVPLRAGLRMGVKLGVVQNVTALATQILPSLFLQRFGTSEWVAYTRIAQRVMHAAMMLTQGISRTALPMLSGTIGLKDLSTLKSSFYRTCLYSGLSIALAFAICLPFVPTLLEWLFPLDYREPIWRICLILLPGFVVLAFSIVNDSFYVVTNTLMVGVWLCILGLIVNTAVVGVLAWLYPTVGVAYGISITLLWSLTHHVYAFFWFRRNPTVA